MTTADNSLSYLLCFPMTFTWYHHDYKVMNTPSCLPYLKIETLYGSLIFELIFELVEVKKTK